MIPISFLGTMTTTIGHTLARMLLETKSSFRVFKGNSSILSEGGGMTKAGDLGLIVRTCSVSLARNSIFPITMEMPSIITSRSFFLRMETINGYTRLIIMGLIKKNQPEIVRLHIILTLGSIGSPPLKIINFLRQQLNIERSIKIVKSIERSIKIVKSIFSS